MSALAERLRALQQQRGTTSAGARGRDDLLADLRRLLARRSTSVRRALVAPAGREIAPGLYQVEQEWPASVAAELRLPWGDAAPVARERLVCFDTETTGLAGGVGTKAFMIGWSCWRGRRLIARQLYLTTLAGEAAMLRCFIDALPAAPIFVSYNGRSYDAPLLKGRYRMHALNHPFDDRRHVDLLHPVRRHFRGAWENCRLQTVERRLLGIVRHDDLPGSEAPAAWLAFLRGQSSINLARVIEHNRQDVLTLALLLDRPEIAQPVPDEEYAGCA